MSRARTIVAALAVATLTGPALARAATNDPGDVSLAQGPAYWLAGQDGGVFSYGDAGFAGGLAGAPLNAPIVGIAPTPSGNGYWLAAADGGVFAFGDAPFAGSASGRPLHAPIVGIATTPSGNGYWLAAADGGVFAYGDAPFLGAASARRLRDPIVGIAATPSGAGYWLAAGDGGVFAYGDAPFLGTSHDLNGWVTAIAATPSGEGYWLAGEDGGVFAFGDAPFLGSAGGSRLNAPIMAMARTWNGRGYWLAAADGGVFAFGNAGYYGSRGGHPLARPISAMAAGLAPHRGGLAPAALTDAHGYDISWPQCGSAYPSSDVSFGIVGVTGGKAFTVNPCLADEAHWSTGGGQAAGVYINLNAPYAEDVDDPSYLARINSGPEGSCRADDPGCQLANFGAASAEAAWATATWQGVSAPTWWLDVETLSNWMSDPGLNGRIIEGAVHALRRHGVNVGIYSTPYQWQEIAGDLQLGLPVWVAGASDPPTAAAWCDGRNGFNGGPVWLVQALPTTFDEDVACGPVLERTAAVFWTANPAAVPVVIPARRPDPRVH